MPTSNSQPLQSPATDKPLGAPEGNEPYKTIRMKNMAQDDGQDVAASDNIYQTKPIGNMAMMPDDPTKPQPKPAQGA